MTSESSQSVCNICKRNNHSASDCWYKRKPQCHYCKKFGHLEKTYRFKEKEQVVNSTQEDEDEGFLFYATKHVQK